MIERVSWDQYFMNLAELAATRSTCPRAAVGCVIVNFSNRVLATGYNGSLEGSEHCNCVIENGGCIRTIHAETNAVADAARRGVSLDNSICYCTHFPCWSCAKTLLSAGVVEIVFKHQYRKLWPLHTPAVVSRILPDGTLERFEPTPLAWP